MWRLSTCTPLATRGTAASAAGAGRPSDSSEPNNNGETGVFTALQGIKAENTLVIAVFLKFILLSTSSVTAAHLARAGYGHSVGVLQGLSLLPVAIGLLLFTRYILKQGLHLRKGFAWGLFVGGVLLLGISHRYSAMQQKYAIPPSPPIATMEARTVQTQDQKARRPALKTGADADRAFAAHQGDSVEREWVNRD